MFLNKSEFNGVKIASDDVIKIFENCINFNEIIINSKTLWEMDIKMTEFLNEKLKEGLNVKIIHLLEKLATIYTILKSFSIKRQIQDLTAIEKKLDSIYFMLETEMLKKKKNVKNR
ncbi:MAG: hypothetical protein ACTSYS_13995 [Promethearchaeota archaeon]